MGGVDQRIFGLSTAAPLEKLKRITPHRDLVVPGQYDPEEDVHGRTIKESMEHLQNLVQCISGGNSIINLLTESNRELMSIIMKFTV